MWNGVIKKRGIPITKLLTLTTLILELHNTFNTINIIHVHDNIILITLLSARAYFFNEHTQVNCKNGHRLTWGPFLETPDNFPGPVSIFSSSFIYQLMVIIGANLAICFTKLYRLKFSFQNQ